ncbi:MAG: ribulose-phosphate 3-epimerase [Coprobacillus sp.]|nr:ribulose-phosphate 3-epimerase [Coprobacillus sp.]
MATEISISTLDIDEENAVSTFYNVETAKIDYFHIDAMDSKFVKNNNMEKMKDYALKINTICMTCLDVHLMVENPKEIIEDFVDYNPDRITFHLEACKDKEEVMDIIKYLSENGIKAGIAINPDTDISKVYEFLPYIHMVLVMTVVPGLGGQSLIPGTLDKVSTLKKYCDENDFDIDIEVDGGINDVTSKKAVEAGANILVVGSYVWKSDDYTAAINKIR